MVHAFTRYPGAYMDTLLYSRGQDLPVRVLFMAVIPSGRVQLMEPPAGRRGQEMEVLKSLPCIRDGLAQDVCRTVAVRVDAVPIPAQVHPTLDASPGKYRTCLYLSVYRHKVRSSHIRLGCITFLLFDHIDPCAERLVFDHLAQPVMRDGHKLLVVLLSHVRILFPELIDTDHKDSYAVVHTVTDDVRTDLVHLVFEETVMLT